TSVSVSCRLVGAKEHLPQGVGAQAEPKRLERDDLVGRDVPEVDGRPELLDEPRLRGLRGRLEDDVYRADPHGDLADQLGPHAAGRLEDAGGAALTRLGDDLPGAGLELLLEPLDPLLG